MFRNRKLKTGTTAILLACFGWMVCGGNAWAESHTARRDPAQVLRRLANDPRLALSPAEKDYLRQAARRLESQPAAAPVRVPAAPVALDTAAKMQEISTGLEQRLTPAAVGRLKSELRSVDRQVMADFAAAESRLHGLPRVIHERHAAARADYQKKMAAVLGHLDAAARAEDPQQARAEAAAAAGLLRTSSSERPHQPVDPDQLPFRSAKPVAPKRITAESAAAIQDMAAQATPPTAADLAANEDVQITPQIRDLAASLGNQPVRIYEWVRNNIEFVPTYGSVQGSQLTLVAKRGNAFDTASLLIALLRAANVPARYVTGKVQVPVGAARNWVGGAATPQVAQQLLGQGGVPTVGLVSGGALTHLRIDHVWVEALVDYVPSRGAVHRSGDTWVPMDASFKLHDFQAASGLFAANPIGEVFQPGDHLFDHDPALGKFTNVDGSVLDERLTDWVARSEEYIRVHGVEKSVMGVLGGQTIAGQPSRAFAGSLPYEVVVRGSAVSTLPAGLRHTVALNGSASMFGGSAFSVEVSLPALNSKRLGITFEPATQADADALAAARNSGAASLPVYLVDVVPVVRLDGAELGRGGAVGMGSFYSIDVVLRGPGGPTTIPYRIVAGDEIVAGITGNGVTPAVVAERFAAHAVDNAPEYLHQVGLHYWAECDYLDQMAARPLGVHPLRLPSVGFFSSPLTVSYVFGAPSSGVYNSRIMDVKQSLLGAAGQDPAKVVAFMKQSGSQGSYLEGAVFDQLEDRPVPQSRGISAMHLIQDAMGQDVPVYRITSANAAAALPLLQLSGAVESDIQTAVSHGKTVLVPETNIEAGPWVGVGYIIQDESTGAGAYMISGGAAGGGLIDCERELVPRWVLVLVLVLLLILLIILIIMMLGGLAPALAAAAAGAEAAFAALLALLRALAGLAPAFA